MQQNKPVILGIKQEILLWGFRTVLRDNRNGEVLDGYIVVEGNEDYELEEAREKVRREYAKLGYTVTACEYDGDNILHIDGLTEFRKLQKSGKRCSKCIYHIKQDSSVGLQDSCNVLDEYKEDFAYGNNQGEEQGAIEQYFNKEGKNCLYFEAVTPTEKPREDDADDLGEIMNMLEGLDEEGAE